MNVKSCNRSVFLSCVLLLLSLNLGVCQIAKCNNCCYDHQNISEPRRSTKSVWQSGQIMLCDNNIRYGWYRFTSFGGSKMPESVVPEGHCGTHDPIWLNGKHPTVVEGNVARTVCINSFGRNNGCYDHFDINVTNCGGYYVYYLKPLYYCATAYCAGLKEPCPYGKEGEPPDCYDPPKEFPSDYIGDPNITYIVVPESPYVPLICKAPLFHGIGTWANVTYLVQWFANGVPSTRGMRCPNDAEASCPEVDYIEFKLFEEEYKIGQTISCNISAMFKTSPKNVWSTPKYTRTPFFVGLEVNQTALDIPTFENCELDTEYVVTFTPTIPVRSYQFGYPKITFHAPEEVIVKSSCEASLMELKPVHLTVTAACKEDSTTGLKPIVLSFRQITPRWDAQYSLPKIWVNVRKVTDIHQCKSVTDPHYFPLHPSGAVSYYDYMGRGDFILYKNTERHFEVQTRQWNCGASFGSVVTCNCGAVVRDHNDVIEFTICSDTLKYNEITPIRYRILSRKCLSPGVSIKSKIHSGRSVDYEVMFRSGAKLEISRNTWGIDVLLFTPRAESLDNEAGLCLNPDQDLNTFGNKWRIKNGESLFHILPPLVNEYKKSYSNVCACLNGICKHPLTVAYGTLFENAKAMKPLISPAFLCDVQKRDVSFSDDPTDEDFKLFSQTPQLRLRVKRDVLFEVSKKNATRYCAERISETKIGKLCAKVGVNVQALVNICSVDIQYTGDFSFASGSIAVLMKECGNLAARNLPIFTNTSSEENGITGSNFVEEIAQLLCPNDCSFNGKCVNGSCVCDKDFTTDDCSASIYQIPTILKLQEDGLCDRRQRPCQKVTVFGTGFINSANMTCHVKEFKVVEGPWTPNNTEQKFPGEMTDLVLADCYLPESPVMQGFFHETNEGVPAAGLVITVSNDGDHKSSENLTFISYDSACMSCNISSGCVLKNNSCFINRYCFGPNETNPIDWCSQCVPEVSSNAWTKRQVNLPPQLPTTTNYYVVSGEYLELPIEVSDPEGMPVIVTLIDGSPRGATVRDNVLLWNATSEISTIFALKATDACQAYSLLNITVSLRSCQCKNNGSCVPHPNKPRGSGYYACDCIPGFTGAMCGTEINECQSFPCFRGYCLDGINSFTCVCDPGYVGWTCDTDYDDCTTSPCVYGNCTDLIADYRCNCNAGYGGKNCSIDVDECESSPCTRGACVDGVNSFTCVCDDGYGGYLCDFEINECQSSPCVHGTCLDKFNSFSCNCEAGFTGASCEVDIDDCRQSPCGNGTCVDLVNNYTCNCNVGFTGANCEVVIKNCTEDSCFPNVTCFKNSHTISCGPCPLGFTGDGKNCKDIDDCGNHTCANGGLCVDGINTYTCNCSAGYTGVRCLSDIDDCVNHTCANGGLCVDGVNSYSCNCSAGYTGESCLTDIDDCLNHTCANGGLCVDGINTYSCNCSAGYTGERCLTDIDDCVNHTCVNGGLCVDGINTYTCNCSAGYTGVRCLTDIDDCVNHTCANGGLCVDGVNSYTCNCSAGYTGERCLTVVSRSLAEETTIMKESTLSMANTPATTFSSIVITTSLKDVLLPTSTSAFTSVYTQQQGQSILLTTTSSAALSSSVFKATTSRPMSPSPKETEAEHVFKMKILQDWNDELRDKESTAFQALSTRLKTEIMKALSSQKDLIGVEVISFSKGSVVAEFQLMFGAKVSSDEAFADLKNQIKDGNLGNLKVDREYLEQIFPATQVPTKKDERKLSFAIIIGISFGGFFIVALITILLVRHCKKKTLLQKRHHSNIMPSDEAFPDRRRYEVERAKSEENILYLEETGLWAKPIEGKENEAYDKL